MKYWIPDTQKVTKSPSQDKLQDKFGGIPWGISEDKWPQCKQCGKAQTFIAQFVHHAERLDLGKEGRVLYIFMCTDNPGICSSWEGESGANSCFVLEPDEIIPCLAILPPDHHLIEPESKVILWIENEDGISKSQAKLFFDDEKILHSRRGGN